MFPALPERTRLFRRLKTHRQITEKFLAEPTLFGVIDSYGIELCHPIRDNHQPHRKRIGKKGFASWKWIVGGKFCVLTNKFGLVTDWQVKTANVSDQEFLPLVEKLSKQTIVLADTGFRRKIASTGRISGRQSNANRLKFAKNCIAKTRTSRFAKLAH